MSGRSSLVRWALCFLLLVGAARSHAAGVDCFRPFLTDVVRDLGPEAAQQVYRKFKTYKPEAQLGVVAVLGAKVADDANLSPHTLEGIYEHFGAGVVSENPLRTDEALFEVIGGMAEQGADGALHLKPGLATTVQNLGADSLGTAQGAAFDLYIAKRVSGDGADYGRVASFEAEVAVGGRQRVIDVVEACGGCTPPLLGIHHENKNFLAPLFASESELSNPPLVGGRFRYEDFKLEGLADEFARDIVLHRGVDPGSAFTFYRLNFRTATDTPEQIDILRQVLAKQFESPFVIAAIPDFGERSLLRDRFLSQFGTVVVFHP